jgi:hypothetical protein
MSNPPLRRKHWVVLACGAVAFAASVFVARGAISRGYLEVPAPSLASDLPAPPAPEASSIAAPIRLPLRTLVDELEDAVPQSFGDLDERIRIPDRDRMSLAILLTRGPFRATVVGNVARLEATVSYSLRAWYDPPVLPEISASCGTGSGPKPRLRVAIEAPITVQDDWSLSTHAKVVMLDRASQADRDRCQMTFAGFDMTDRIVSSARSFLEDHTKDIDAAAARVDLKSKIDEWWTTLQEPIRLTDSLWLVFRPEAIRRAPPVGTGDSLEIALEMRARPGIVMGARPTLARTELPALDTGFVSPKLELYVDAFADYQAVSSVLQEEVGGAEFERGGRTVRLDSVRVFGIGGGRLAVEVLTSGDVVSRLFLTGTPELDLATGVFSIPDLNYDVRTRSVLIATLAWLGNSTVRDLLRERASWPATPAVDWLRDRLLEGLNRNLSDELRVSGRVEGIRILGIHARRDVLLIRVGATGSARLFVIDDSVDAKPAAPPAAVPAANASAGARLR